MNYTGRIVAYGEVEKMIDAIKLELGDFGRSKISVNKIPEGAEFLIESKDAVSLRATLNALSQSLSIWEKMEKI